MRRTKHKILQLFTFIPPNNDFSLLCVRFMTEAPFQSIHRTSIRWEWAVFRIVSIGEWGIFRLKMYITFPFHTLHSTLDILAPRHVSKRKLGNFVQPNFCCVHLSALRVRFRLWYTHMALATSFFYFGKWITRTHMKFVVEYREEKRAWMKKGMGWIGWHSIVWWRIMLKRV